MLVAVGGRIKRKRQISFSVLFASWLVVTQTQDFFGVGPSHILAAHAFAFSTSVFTTWQYWCNFYAVSNINIAHS